MLLGDEGDAHHVGGAGRAEGNAGHHDDAVAGVPFGTPGATNMVRIVYVTQEHAAKA